MKQKLIASICMGEIMKNKIHSVLITILLPIILVVVLPVLKVSLQEWQAVNIFRGYWKGYFFADSFLSCIFALCICYLFWFNQKNIELNKKRLVSMGLAVMLILIILTIASYLLGNVYPLLCMMEQLMCPFTAIIIYICLARLC